MSDASQNEQQEATAPYIFFREEGWYPVEIRPSQVLKNVELNPGTLKVEDIFGNVVWRLQ